jgi:hypothetical protein
MVEPKIETYDSIQRYCRILGHEVPFSYCRIMSQDLPCRNILDCWKGVFPIQDFIEHFYSEEEIARFLEPPKPKLAQIFEIMEKAKKSSSKK